MDKIYSYVIQYGMSVLAAIVIFFIGRWLAHAISDLVEKALIKAKINRTLATFVNHLAFYAVMTFVVIAALNKLGVETSSFIAVVGAAGLAIGLAFQSSLSNFSSGVMLILFQPFQVGDTIEAGGAVGVVQEIQIFNTILITKENKKVIVPNAKIIADKITIEKEA